MKLQKKNDTKLKKEPWNGSFFHEENGGESYENHGSKGKDAHADGAAAGGVGGFCQSNPSILSDEEINNIKPYVPQTIEGVARLYMATKAGQPVAFMGTEKGSLEMLFIASAERGKGLGK